MTSSDAESDEKTKMNKLLQLPMARIKTIMKSSPDIGNVHHEGYYTITKATELFVHYLAQQAYEESKNKKTLDYKALSDVVRTDESLEFLEEIIPRKIKVSEYWEKIGYSPETDNDLPLKIPNSPTVKSPLMSPLSGNTKSTEPIVID